MLAAVAVLLLCLCVCVRFVFLDAAGFACFCFSSDAHSLLHAMSGPVSLISVLVRRLFVALWSSNGQLRKFVCRRCSIYCTSADYATYYQSVTGPISTNTASAEADNVRLAHDTCFVTSPLELVVVAVPLRFWWRIFQRGGLSFI